MKLVYCQSSRELKEPSQNRQQKSSVQFQGFCVLFLLFLKFIVFWIFASFFWQPLRSRSSRPKFNSLVWIRRMFSVEVSKLISLKCFGFLPPNFWTHLHRHILPEGLENVATICFGCLCFRVLFSVGFCSPCCNRKLFAFVFLTNKLRKEWMKNESKTHERG